MADFRVEMMNEGNRGFIPSVSECHWDLSVKAYGWIWGCIFIPRGIWQFAQKSDINMKNPDSPLISPYLVHCRLNSFVIKMRNVSVCSWHRLTYDRLPTCVIVLWWWEWWLKNINVKRPLWWWRDMTDGFTRSKAKEAWLCCEKHTMSFRINNDRGWKRVDEKASP